MKFTGMPVADATGQVLAHTLRLPEGPVLKKGHVLTAQDVAQIEAAGRAHVVAAKLEPGDVDENEAARAVADALAGRSVRVGDAFTGRANLYAEVRGLVALKPTRVDDLNAIDEAVTLATLQPLSVVAAGDMVATVKIIPFAVSETVVTEAKRRASLDEPLIVVVPLVAHRVGVVVTRLADTPARLLDGATRSLRDRVEALGSQLAEERRVEHDELAVARAITELRDAGCSPILVFGASAIVDRRDVVPRGLELAGGSVEHLGMPVDPGNLLMLGSLGALPVVGVPGCARSPKPSGFDAVLARLLADLPVTGKDLSRMGVGGLLKEIPLRGLPRDRRKRALRVDAIVLAAGTSSRMGRENKLLSDVAGAPMIARVVDTVGASRVRRTIVVVGYDREAVRRALAQRPVTFVDNPEHEAGLSTSLRAGLGATGDDADAVLVCLGDMPRVTSADIDALIEAFDPVEGRSICVPAHAGRRGNPVLWSARFAPELASVTGDKGGRDLMKKYAEELCMVLVASDGVTFDVDTTDDLGALRALGERES